MTNLLVIASSSCQITGYEHSDDGIRWKLRSMAAQLVQQTSVVQVIDKPMRFVRPIDDGILFVAEVEQLLSAAQVEQRLTVLEGRVNQDVRTTATPSFTNGVKIGANQVIGARYGGFSAISGVPDPDTPIDTETVDVKSLARRLKAIEDVLAAHHGLIAEDA